MSTKTTTADYGALYRLNMFFAMMGETGSIKACVEERPARAAPAEVCGGVWSTLAFFLPSLHASAPSPAL